MVYCARAGAGVAVAVGVNVGSAGMIGGTEVSVGGRLMAVGAVIGVEQDASMDINKTQRAKRNRLGVWRMGSIVNENPPGRCGRVRACLFRL